MSVKRIPLTWLQAFEAAGRLGSFKSAAEELSVSPSNISHQVRDLEAYLGLPLFHRTGREVRLTQEGANYLPELTQGFQTLKSARPSAAQPTPRFSIGAFPFLANEIITPHIASLTAATGVDDILIYTRTDVAALTHVDPAERIDIVVRYAARDARFPGLTAVKIADVALVPIVGPQVEANDVDTFLAQPLIRVIGPFRGWERWLQTFAPEREALSVGLQTDSFHAAMQSVARGEAACLGVLPYLTPWIRAGKVRALEAWQLAIEDQAAFAVIAPFQETNPHLEACIEWLSRHLN